MLTWKVESKLYSDHVQAQELLSYLRDVKKNVNSFRIGISGPPGLLLHQSLIKCGGVGKSTFIESFGKLLTKEHKVAVLV